MDYDSVVNTIAAGGTVVALVFAVRAYSVAQRSNAIAAEQNALAAEQARKAFELGVIKEMGQILDGLTEDVPGRKKRDLTYQERDLIDGKLMLVDTNGEFPVWLAAARGAEADPRVVGAMTLELIRAVQCRVS